MSGRERMVLLKYSCNQYSQWRFWVGGSETPERRTDNNVYDIRPRKFPSQLAFARWPTVSINVSKNTHPKCVTEKLLVHWPESNLSRIGEIHKRLLCWQHA